MPRRVRAGSNWKDNQVGLRVRATALALAVSTAGVLGALGAPTRASADTAATSSFCVQSNTGPQGWSAWPGDNFIGGFYLADLYEFGTFISTSDYSVTVDWGDGTTEAASLAAPFTTGDIDADGLPCGGKLYLGPYHEMHVQTFHVYSTIGRYTASVTVQSLVDTRQYTFVTIPINVSGPPLLAQQRGFDITTPNVDQTLLTFTEPDPSAVADRYSTLINWGDGTFGTGTVTGSNGSFTVSGSHTYADPSQPREICMKVHDTYDTVFETDLFDCTDHYEPAIAATGGYSFDLPEGGTVDGTVATFTDAEAGLTPTDFTASIDWGDASPPSTGIIDGSGGSFTVSDSHRYPHNGSYTITVKIVKTTEPYFSATTNSATVTDAVNVTGDAPITAFNLTPLHEELSAVHGTVASFTDPDTTAVPGDYVASIDWGDGTFSDGSISLVEQFAGATTAAFSISGSHIYDSINRYTITTTITDLDNPENTATSTTYAEPQLPTTGGFSFSAQAGDSISGTLATFTDPDTTEPAGDYTTLIDWGDAGGHFVLGPTPTGSDGSFTVSGSHTYATPGTYTIQVAVVDFDAAFPAFSNQFIVEDTATITVDTSPPTISCTPPDDTTWYGREVSVPCTASDSGSGLANADDASFSLTTAVGAGNENIAASTDTHEVCDNKGNCATAGPYTFKVDLKAPQLASCDSPDGAWHANNATLYCTYTDGGSGAETSKVALTTAVAAGSETSNGVASAGGAQVCDAMGNCAPSPADIPGNKIDRKAPVITCNAATFMFNQSPANVTASATDGGSGPASQTVSAPAGTNVVGTGSVTVTASDAVGNSANKSCAYSVGYGFGGFQAPFPKSTLVKSGAAISAKFTLTDAGGSLSSAAASALATAGNVEVVLSGPGITPVATLCTWDPVGLDFQCSIKTPKGLLTGTSNPYTVTAELNLGSGFTAVPSNGSAVNPAIIYFK
jgi:hypothetical protein